MVYVKSCIPHRLIKEYCGSYDGIDFLTFEFVIKSRKWYVSYLYRPPSVKEVVLCELLKSLCDTFIVGNNLFMAFGDLNSNFLSTNMITDFCEVQGIENLIKNFYMFQKHNSHIVRCVLNKYAEMFQWCY